MVMDTLALAVSASANYLLRYKEAQRMMLPLVAFPICGLGDLFCIYHELKAVQLRTLNRERGEMIAERWLEQTQVGMGAIGWAQGVCAWLRTRRGRGRDRAGKGLVAGAGTEGGGGGWVEVEGMQRCMVTVGRMLLCAEEGCLKSEGR
jgi:hypothetical protein